MSSPTPFTIRRLGAGDARLLEALMAVFGEAFREIHEYTGARPRADYQEARLADETCIALAALVDGAPIGGLVAYELRKLEREGSEIYIHDLAVAAEHRRHGVASALLRRVQLLARRRGAKVIYIQAEEGDDPAIAVYAHFARPRRIVHFEIPPHGRNPD